MKTIAIVNEKGGTAKTTTSVNLAAALGEMGKKVLLVDLDGQAASSRWLGVEEDHRLADAILAGGGLEPIENVLPGVSLAPASGKLDSISHGLRPTQGGQLRKALAEIEDRYDYILIDCPPSLGNRLIGNGLLAATHVIVPVEASVLALDGLRILLVMLEDIRSGFGHDIELIGALACRFRRQTRLSNLVLSELRHALGRRVFSTAIRETTKMQECPASGTSIMQFAPTCASAVDYRSVAREVVYGIVVPTVDASGEADLAAERELSLEEQVSVLDFRNHISGVFGGTPKAAEAPAAVDAVQADTCDIGSVTDLLFDNPADPCERTAVMPAIVPEQDEAPQPAPAEPEAILQFRSDPLGGAAEEKPAGGDDAVVEVARARWSARPMAKVAMLAVALGLLAGVHLVWTDAQTPSQAAAAKVSQTYPPVEECDAVTGAGGVDAQTPAAWPCPPADADAPSDADLPVAEASDAPPDGSPAVAVATGDDPSPATEAGSVEELTAPLQTDPSDSPHDPAADFALSCVMEGAGFTTAVINGEVVGVGQTIAGAKVLAIGVDSVRLEVNGVEFNVGIDDRSDSPGGVGGEQSESS